MLLLHAAAAPARVSSPALPPKSPARTAPLFFPRLSPIVHHRGCRTISLPRPATLRAAGRGGARGASSLPARDRVIDFGRHKGQMLGTLPPAYLRWVVAELDYGETAPWAALAREVLGDPAYVDRVEWEHAHRFLRGDSKWDYAYDDDNGDGEDGPLQEMAERFGWDLSDEDGWGRLDFRLLGTSYGGRIPRKRDRSQSSRSGSPPRDALVDIGAGEQDGPKGKRDERRERMRARREEQTRAAKLDVLGVGVNPGALGAPRKARIGAAAKKEILGLGSRGSRGGDVVGERAVVVPRKGGEGGNPFPGRQAFLDKVRKLKGDDT